MAQDLEAGMTEHFTERQIDGKQIFLHQKGEGGPIIFWGTYFHREDELEHLLVSLEEEIPGENYIVVAFLAEDWNRDFSPWEAEPVFGDEAFGGKGPEMLRWLTEDCVPAITEEFGIDRKRFLIGYSLAGLFTLWAAYETDLFAGIACCSGSMWFKDWDAYVSNHAIAGKCSVYLSLGSKEEKTRNQHMAKVGDRTREQEQILQLDPCVESVVLEWNKGGHFADSGKRLAKGVRWLMKYCSGKLFAAVAEMAWENQADSVRVDTHPENLTMQRALERAGFTNCGELVLLSGDEVGDLRYGYELKKEGTV